MSVACVASYKRALVYRVLRGHALSDCKISVSNLISGGIRSSDFQGPRLLTDVDRPPVDLPILHLHPVRLQDFLGLREDLRGARPVLVCPARHRVYDVAVRPLLDIQTEQVFFTRDEHDRALVRLRE